MKIVRYEDPKAFREEVRVFLLEDEARHSLLLGLIDTLVENPEVYRQFDLRLVEENGAPVAVALRTPPHNVVVSAPSVAGAVEALANGLAAEGVELPGVVGGLPEADVFAEVYLDATGRRVGTRMNQAIHVLETLEDVPVPPGSPREAGPEDVELILPWYRAFHEEGGLGGSWDEDQVRRRLTRRLAEDRGDGIRLWEDPEPVCVVGSTGERVGPVYTPPEKRRRGYATALTAHVSREVLARGSRFCLLYTDLANPTSNAIYRRIGYVPVCDSAMILFASSGEK